MTFSSWLMSRSDQCVIPTTANTGMPHSKQPSLRAAACLGLHLGLHLYATTAGHRRRQSHLLHQICPLASVDNACLCSPTVYRTPFAACTRISILASTSLAGIGLTHTGWYSPPKRGSCQLVASSSFHQSGWEVMRYGPAGFAGAT